MKYFVRVDGKEWTVEVEGLSVRVGDRRVDLEPGPIPGTFAASWGGRKVLFHDWPSSRPGVRSLIAAGRLVSGTIESERDRLRASVPRARAAAGAALVTSAIPGVVRQVFCRVGDRVEAGTALLTLEAMKMENEVRSPSAGRVAAVEVVSGQPVAAGQVLARFDAV